MRKLSLLVLLASAACSASPERPPAERAPRAAPAPRPVVAPPPARASDPAPLPAADGAAPSSASAAAGSAPSAPPAVKVPPLGPFDEAALPRTKIDLIALVDRALTTGSSALMGSVMVDSATMLKRCRQDKPEDLGTGSDVRRGEGADAFASCTSLVDWSRARRLGLDYGSGVGRPLRSCGFAKHEIAHLYYDVAGDHVRVSLHAFGFGGRVAVTLPLKCTVNAQGWSVAGREKALAGRNGENRGRCPATGWPIVRDPGRACPAPRRP